MKASRGYSRLTPILLSLVTVIVYIDTHTLHPFLALYAVGLGAGTLMVGIIIAAYSLFEDVFEVPIGYVMDKIGRRRGFLIGGLIADAGNMILYALSSNPLQLLGVRVLHGAGGSVAGPAIMSLTADVPHPLAKMGARMGLYGTSIIAATVIGWIIGGVISSQIGYAPLFYMVSALLLLGLVMAFFIREPPPLFENPTPRKAKVSVRELVARFSGLLRRREYTVACLSIFAHMMTMGALVTLLPLYIEELGMTSLHVGMILATYGLFCLIFQVPMGMLSDRVGRKATLLSGLGFVSISIFAMSLVRTFELLLFIAAIYGASYALLFPTLCALVIESSTFGERALASSFFHIMFTQGVTVGAPLFALVAASFGFNVGLGASCLAPLTVLPIAAVLLRSQSKSKTG